jgi:hypothetical protein
LISASMLEGEKTRRRRSTSRRRRTSSSSSSSSRRRRTSSSSSSRRRRTSSSSTSCTDSTRGGTTGNLPGTLPIGKISMPRTPGCCKIGNCCMGCGAGGLGVCHKNAATCGNPKICGGRFDASAVAPQCR